MVLGPITFPSPMERMEDEVNSHAGGVFNPLSPTKKGCCESSNVNQSNCKDNLEKQSESQWILDDSRPNPSF
jgi:hypothetical protein